MMPNDSQPSTLAPSTYCFVSPRLERKRPTHERRCAERHPARIDVEHKGATPVRFTSVDVSVNGLLMVPESPSPLPPLRQPLMVTLHLPDGPLPAMAVVARHACVDGAPALALRLLGMTEEREERWLRALARLAEARRSNALIERALLPCAPRRETEYILVADETTHGK